MMTVTLEGYHSCDMLKNKKGFVATEQFGWDDKHTVPKYIRFSNVFSLEFLKGNATCLSVAKITAEDIIFLTKEEYEATQKGISVPYTNVIKAEAFNKKNADLLDKLEKEIGGYSYTYSDNFLNSLRKLSNA
ncbi:MAG: hypothetical protein LBK92_03840 [Endomicrobium sp.]|jgi:hypothetical protein|nr:hypothetical protein [Endomicrobium sp.]